MRDITLSGQGVRGSQGISRSPFSQPGAGAKDRYLHPNHGLDRHPAVAQMSLYFFLTSLLSFFLSFLLSFFLLLFFLVCVCVCAIFIQLHETRMDHGGC